jgi:hypothetical protein
MRRVNQKEINIPFGGEEKHERSCQHPGCLETGLYRAPMARNLLTEYYWFCLAHVRSYNLSWNFFSGMNETEIERQRRHDTVWQRPSWPFGRFGARPNKPHSSRGPSFSDGFGFFNERAGQAEKPRPMTEEQKALAILDLAEPVTFQDIKTRYKTLAKKLHPDATGGNTSAEDKLKAVNQAYAALKISFA